jgi:hypothetical protein
LFGGEFSSREILNMFEDYSQVGIIESKYYRQKVTKIFLFSKAKNSTNEMFNKPAKERKQNFDIFLFNLAANNYKK